MKDVRDWNWRRINTVYMVALVAAVTFCAVLSFRSAVHFHGDWRYVLGHSMAMFALGSLVTTLVCYIRHGDWPGTAGHPPSSQE